MFTQSQLLRRPLPPKLRPKLLCPKPLYPKKEKNQSAITNEVLKQQDLPKPSLSKIIPKEMEKKIIPRKFFKRRKQSKIHVKNLLFKWKIKGDLDKTPKKHSNIYLLISKVKDSCGSPIYIPVCSWGKEESVSEKSYTIKNFLMDSTSETSETEKHSKTISSRSLTPLSSRSGHLSSYRKTNKDGITTPDLAYGPFTMPFMNMAEEKNEAKNKSQWISKVQPSHEIISNQIFSFDKLLVPEAKKGNTTALTESIKKGRRKKKTESKLSLVPSDTSDLPTDLLTKFEDEHHEDNELAIYGEGFFSRDAIDVNNPKLNLAKIAVLRCHQYGRNALNFKGFFIDKCPKLDILAHILVYINLSFNNFTEFPQEVLIVEHLQVLVMRNNPIKELSPNIKELHHLKIFIISFNLLTSLPNELFLLYELEFLDVSYNEITSIPNAIESLSSLSTLNVDGNELYYLPPGILKLHLETFIVENNFIHPLLWKESCKNYVQSLKDLALLAFSFHQLEKVYKELPPGITEQLVSSNVCDCCRGPMYGQGLRIIRPIDAFNVSVIPILFCVCSVKCYNYIQRNVTTSVDPDLF